MRKMRPLRILLATGTALAGLGGLSQAMAQAPSEIGEIVVTAKNRTERLQDVPLAITAITGDALKQAEIRDARDLQRLTPSLNIYVGQGRNDPTAQSLRGIAPNTSDERYQGISFFLDGVALSGQLTSLDTSQIERVEIIKGPQSASFGRATYTGAINYITKDPSGDSVSGSVTLRGGVNKGNMEKNYQASGYMAFPILQDRLWGSVEGTLMQQGGWVRAINNGQVAGRERTQSVAGSLFYKPNDALSVKLRVSYSHDRDTTALSSLQHPRDWLLAGVPTVNLPRASGSFWPTVVPDPEIGIITDRGKNINPSLPDGGYQRDRLFTSLVATYDFGGHELSYRGGYFWSQDVRQGAGVVATQRSELFDPVFGPLVASGQVTVATTQISPASLLISKERFENYSHQLLWLSPTEARFRYKLGLYHFKETSLNNFSSFIAAGNPSGQVRGPEAIKNTAVFGGMDFDFTDQLTLSGEGRYQEESVGNDACVFCTQGVPTGASFKTNSFLPRVTLSYDATPNNLLYALYSYGVKSGRISGITISGARSLYYAPPEKLDNYEIGSKNTFLGGRMLLNLAAYYEKLKDQQLVSAVSFTTPGGGIVNQTIANSVGASRVYGFEAETSVAITRRLTVQAGVGYADHQFTNTTPLALSAAATVTFPGVANAPVVLDGKTQSNVPKWNGFFTAEYAVPDVWGDFSAAVRFSGSYRGSFFADVANVAQVPSTWNFNGRLRLYRDDMELAIYSRNMFNDRTAAGTGLAGSTSPCFFVERNTAQFGSNQQCLLVGVQRPREVGIELTKRF